MSVRELFSFPNPVNDKAARVVAGVVLALPILLALKVGATWAHRKQDVSR